LRRIYLTLFYDLLFVLSGDLLYICNVIKTLKTMFKILIGFTDDRVQEYYGEAEIWLDIPQIPQTGSALIVLDKVGENNWLYVQKVLYYYNESNNFEYVEVLVNDR